MEVWQWVEWAIDQVINFSHKNAGSVALDKAVSVCLFVC
jgi:hypothetical protein